MLSYQHEYHAGNFADVLKHCCLLEILSSLAQKEKPFTIIDTHAGSSIYSLNDERILKTGEAENGIKKLLQFTKDNQTPLPHSVSLYLEKERNHTLQEVEVILLNDYVYRLILPKDSLSLGRISLYQEKMQELF